MPVHLAPTVTGRLHIAQDAVIRATATVGGLKEAQRFFIAAFAAHCSDKTLLAGIQACHDAQIAELERIVGGYRAELDALTAKADEVLS